MTVDPADELVAGLDYFENEEAEQPEEAKPTLKVIQNAKPPKRGVRARKKLAQELQAAWEKCMEGKDEDGQSSMYHGFTAVPDDVLWAVALSGCNEKDVPTYALMLSREIRWLFLNNGRVNKWARGRFATIQQIGVETLSTLHVARGYVQWRNGQPWCERWKTSRAYHWHPNEEFIEFLESGRRAADAAARKAARQKRGGTA
jgi:hypothetical protein